MNKVDLIQALKDSNNLSKSEAETVINLFFNKIADALAQGKGLKSGVFVPFSLKNTVPTPVETQKPVRRLKLRGKSFLFSRWARS